ncbi:AI-2E family transporter [Modestobacter italicus]|uniref:AI-2E family transporter n=1 Tax=Modestobacter italicus (strain DSM 44449 / CECT 9708 / BC 501) TaxID=2732864 RepID=UPI0022B234A9|nr:AI-2E family transporter [Modestobacter marinus]
MVLLGSAGAVVTIAGIRAFADLLGPVFLALVLTISVHPTLRRLQRRGWPRWLAVTVTTLAVIGFVLALALSLALAVTRLATLLPTYADRFAELLGQLNSTLSRWGIGEEQIATALDRIDLGALASLLEKLVAGLAGALSSVLFLLFLLLFMGVDAAGFPGRLRAVSTTRPAIVTALVSFAEGTRSYLNVSTVFGLVVAVIDTAALWLLGVPLPLLWGLLSYVTNYIPNIGFIIGLAPPALLALLEGGPRLMLVVIVVYSGVNFVIQSVIQPKFVGDAVNLSLPLTFLSLVFWTAVIGPVGAILAIPLTLLAKALLVDIDPNTRWLAHLVTSNAPDDPPDVTATDDARPSVGPSVRKAPAEALSVHEVPRQGID